MSALEEILAGQELADGAAKPMPANPFRAIDDRPSARVAFKSTAGIEGGTAGRGVESEARYTRIRVHTQPIRSSPAPQCRR